MWKAAFADNRHLIPSVMLALCVLFHAAPAVSATPSALQALIDERGKIAKRLSHTIAKCVRRRDTDHATFYGCIDWHSSVHGFWALIAYQRATGDKRYAKTLASRLKPSAVAREAKLLRRAPRFEMPYGRAWFLRLAVEHNKLTGLDTLKPMADEVMRSLMDRYLNGPIRPKRASYGSASWALINMHDYAVHRGDAAARSQIETWVREQFIAGKPRCRHAWDGHSFMAVCTNWAWLAAKVLPPQQLKPWLDRFFADSGLPTPIRNPRPWHQFGLNFSRAWGLWALYEATGDAQYAKAYAAHFRASYDRPANWRGNYQGVGHWVAQFGFLALQPLFAER